MDFNKFHHNLLNNENWKIYADSGIHFNRIIELLKDDADETEPTV